MDTLGADFEKLLAAHFKRGRKEPINPGYEVCVFAYGVGPLSSRGTAAHMFTAAQAVAMARRLLECAGLKPALECPGHERGGMLEPCCRRAGEYNGYGSDGPTTFTCPKHCSCHD